MDQAMVKRGIGAVVLAIIAALLLGYLLKDKSRERQEVVDMKLPDSAEMSIPDLSGPADSSANNEVSIVGEAGNTINQAANNAADNVQNSVIASADAVNNVFQKPDESAPASEENYSSNDPGFSIRPPAVNETREIIDEKNNNNTQNSGSAAIAYSTDPVNEVIASSNKAVKKFKPSIVEEKRKAKPKKKVTHKTAKKPAKAATAKTTTKPNKTSVAKTVPVKPPVATPSIDNKPLGKYSIQILATSSQSRANKLANTMKSEGYKVFVTRTQNNNKVLFRVRIGGHANRDQAVKAQDGMKRRYQKNFFIQNSLVVSN
jgi:cell division septation protein DedD